MTFTAPKLFHVTNVHARPTKALCTMFGVNASPIGVRPRLPLAPANGRQAPTEAGPIKPLVRVRFGVWER